VTTTCNASSAYRSERGSGAPTLISGSCCQDRRTRSASIQLQGHSEYRRIATGDRQAAGEAATTRPMVAAAK